MAIVTKTESSTPKWEEFVTIKLSKREAAGLLFLIGPAPNGTIVKYDMYSELDDLVGGHTEYGDFTNELDMYSNASKFLDKIYGKL